MIQWLVHILLPMEFGFEGLIVGLPLTRGLENLSGCHCRVSREHHQAEAPWWTDFAWGLDVAFLNFWGVEGSKKR